MPTLQEYLNSPEYIAQQGQQNNLYKESDKLKKAREQQYQQDYLSQLQSTLTATENVGSRFQTDSKFDQGMPGSALADIGEYRGQVQSTADKWANAAGKMAITAGTTFLDGTLGTVWGLAEMLAGGSFVNNAFSNAMADITEWQEKVLPNYYTREEIESPWYTNLGTANFWADKVFKNMGFAVGAMYSGSAWAGVARGILGTTKVANNVAKGLATKFFKGNVDDALIALKNGKISPEMLMGELAKDARLLKTHNLVQQVIGSTTGAIGESRIEAINGAREFEDRHAGELSAMIPQFEAEAAAQGLQGEDALAYIEGKYNEEKAKLAKVVDAHRNSVFIMDAIALTAGNALQFGKTFSGGYSNVKRAKNLVNKIVDGVPTKELQIARKNIAQRISGYFKDAFVEGHEELTQGVIQATGDEFYAQKVNPKGDTALKSYAEIFAQQYIEHVTSPDKWEEFIIGAFTGFIGTPSFGTGKMWSGGVFNAVLEDRADAQYAQEIASKWNEFVNSDRYKGVVRSLAYEQDKSKFLEEGNQFEYKNAENGQFVSDVITAMQADKFEDLLEVFEGMPNAATPEEVRDMHKVSKDAQGKEIPVNERKGIFDAKTDEEIKQYMSKRSRTLVQKAKEVRDIADKVELKFGDAPSSVKETLIYYLSSVKDSETRIKELNQELTTNAPAISIPLNDIRPQLVENNGKITKELKEIIDNTKKFLQEVEKNNPSTEVVQAFEDLIKLEQRRVQFVDLYEKTATPDGLQKIQETQQKFDKESADLVDRVDAQAKFTEGKDIVDKSTGQVVGTLIKVGDEWRIVKYDDNENATETVVNPASREFIDKYDVFTSPEETPKKVAPKSYLDRNTGDEVTVQSHPTKEGFFLAKSKNGKRSWELTKEQLDEKFVYNYKPEQEVKSTYRRNSDGKTVIVVKDALGNLRIKESYTDKQGVKRTRYEETSIEELNKNYTHKKTYENRRTHLKVKNRSIQAVENLIEDLESKIAQLEDSIAKTEPIEFIRQEIKALQEQVEKNDRRQTQKSVQKILDKINELNDEVEVRTQIVTEQEQELAKLNSEKDTLYQSLQRLENWEEGQAHPIRERIKEVEERISENEGIISLWKKSIEGLKKFINSVLDAMGLAKVYQDLTFKLHGKEAKQTAAKLKKYTDFVAKNDHRLLGNFERVSRAQRAIEAFEKENELLMDELLILQDVAQEYRNLLKQEIYAQYKDPNATIPYLASIDGMTDGVQVGNEENSISNEQLEKEEKALREDRAARHPLDMFRGLRGRHYKDDKDTELNTDEAQRRYYRFTNNVNLNGTDFRLKLEYKESSEVVQRSYSHPLDQKPIAAYIVNKDGQYVDEFGQPTTKDKGVYSFMPSVQYPAEVYQPADMTKETLAELKEKLTAEYVEAKTKIIEKLDKGEEVTLPIVGKSNGVPRTNFKELGENSRTPLNELVEDKDDIDIVVATDKYTTMPSGKTVRTKPGFVYIEDSKTGNILPVTPRKLSTKEIDLVVDLFKMYVSQAKKKADGSLDFSNAGKLHFIDDSGVLQPMPGERSSMFKFLGDIMFWTQDNFTEDAKKLIKNGTLTREVAATNPKYLVNKDKNSKQAFYFIPTPFPGGAIKLGKVSPVAQLMENNGREWVMHRLFERVLREFLATQYINPSSALIKNEGGFLGITAVKKNDAGEYYVEVNPEYSRDKGYEKWLKDSNALESRIISNKLIDKQYGEPIPQVTSSYVIFDYDEYVENKPAKPKVLEGNAALAEESASTEKVSDARALLDKLGVGKQPDLSPEGVREIQDAVQQEKEDLKGVVLSEKDILSATSSAEVAGAVVDDMVDAKEVPDSDYFNAEEADDSPEVFRPAKETKEVINTLRATEWLTRVLGDKVAVRVSKHMLSGNNWGSYRKGIITLFENAGVGTEFHEAFHAVIDLFYTEQEKKKLYNTYRSLTGKKLNDKAVEEELAEDFANHMLGNSPAYLKKPSFIKRAFNKIFNFVRKMRGIATIEAQTISDLFEAIDKGKFASRPTIASNLGEYAATVARGNIPGLTVYDKKEILEGVNAHFFGRIFREQDGLASLFSKDSNAEFINSIYDSAKASIYKAGANITVLLKKETNNDNRNDLLRKQTILIEAHKNFDEVVKMHRELLLQYDLEFVEDTWNKDVNENDRTKDSGQLWAVESLKLSSKHNASREIKFLLGSIPVVNPANEKGNSTAVLNSLGLPMTVDFGQGFNILINKLSGLTDWADMKSILLELSTDLPWVWTLGKRLGINKGDDELTTNEFNLRTQFIQTMAKTTNEFYLSMVLGSDTTIVSSNQNSFNKRRIREWENNAKALVKRNSKLYTIDPNGDIKYNAKAFEYRIITDINSSLNFLKGIGIEFSNVERAKTLYAAEIDNRAKGMLKTIQKGEGVLVFRDEEGGNSYEDLNTLAEIERKTTVSAVENSLFNINGEIVYGQTLNNYLSLVINEINRVKTLEELYNKLPHLKGITSSLVLKNFKAGKVLGLRIHEGTAQKEYSGTKKSFDDLKPGDRLREIMYNFDKGNYALLRPADNSIERFLELGKFFNRVEIMQNGAHLNAMIDYLQEELLDMKTLQEGNWSNISKNFGKGLVLDMIKKVDPVRANEIAKLVQENKNISEYINTNRELLKSNLRTYFNQQVEANKKLITDNLLAEKNSEGKYDVNGLPTKEVISEQELEAFVREFTANSLIANIEQVKLFAGNPAFYKTVEDQFKRNSGQVGTKKISIVSDYMNTWIGQYMDKHGLAPFTNKIKDVHPVLRTAVLADVKTVSAELENYKKVVGDKVSKYDEMDEADAQGYIHLSEYRRMLMRAGDWSFGKGSLEEAYQYQIGRKTYIDPKTGTELFTIDSNRINKVVFNALKPQHFGPLAEEGFVPGFYKLSVIPVLPKVANLKNNKGKLQYLNLSKLNKQMESQETGLVVFASGNKVGTKLDKNGAIQPAYNENGEFNFSEKNQMVTQDTYYKYWGIQVDMGNKSKNKVVWGTQMAKQIINSLMENGAYKKGVFTLDGKKLSTQQIVEKYLSLNEQRIQAGFNELLQKFGLSYNTEGVLISKDPQKLIDTLKEQAIADNLSENIIFAIEDIAEHGIDIAPNRKKLEQVLMAMADKTSISQKTFGKPLVQVANTFFEKSGIRTVRTKTKDGKTFTYYESNELKSYGVEYNEAGEIVKVKSMQVYLPAIYKGITDISKLPVEARTLIGFRIPTQGLNSIESIEIAGFLPEEMGDIIVLPTEIVAKAGSDFDIDKLNVFLANLVILKDGSTRYIRNDRAQWESYQLEGTLTEGEDKLMTWEQWQKKAIENELIKVMQSIATSPMNAQQLLSPNQVDPIKNEANYIEYLEWKRDGKWKGTFDKSFKDALKKEKDNTPYNRIVELEYQMDLAERFLGGKSAIGITAIHSTFHILSQMNDLFIKPFYRIEDKGLKKEVDMPTKINMKHNEKEGNIRLGGLISKAGDSIVEELSMWINAAVDAAKDPFMFKLNAGPQTLNVVLYLTMAGVARKNIALFMNQPIIKRYLDLQSKYESIMADSTGINKGKKYKNEIEKLVLSEFGLAKFDWAETATELNDAVLQQEFLNPTSLQAQILSDFLRYQETAKILREVAQSVTYDTAGAGKTTSELLYRLQTTEYVKAEELIGNYNKLIESGFIAPYYQTAQKIQSIMKEYIPHLKSPAIIKGFEDFVSRYIQPHINLKEEDVTNAIEKFKEDLLVYLVMTTNNNSNHQEPLKNDFDRLFKGDKSMANRIKALRVKYPRNTLLNNLLPIFNNNTKGIDNAKMYITKLETIESNQLTEDWKALYEGGERKFARDLIKFIIIQSGLNNSPLNFINLAPQQYYAEIMNGVVADIENVTAAQMEDFGGDNGQFWLHHPLDKAIIPTRRTKGFPYYRSWNKTQQQYVIYDYDTKQAVNMEGMPIVDFKNNSTAKRYGLMNTPIINSETDTKEDRSKKNTIVDKIVEGLSQITSGMWDKVIAERKLNKDQLIKELTNAKTDSDVANILKKLC